MPKESKEFPGEPEAIGEARHFVVDALRRHSCAAPVIEDAALLVSELATNAVVHARSSFGVVLVMDTAELRLEVRDEDPGLSALREIGPDATTGRGMHIVEELSSRWGVEAIPDDGKVVWAQLKVG